MSPSRKVRWPVLNRIQRVGSLFLGLEYLGVFFLAPEDISRYSSLTSSWWAPIGAVVIVGSSLALIAVSVLNRTEYLERVAFLSAGAYLALIIVWFVGWTGQSVPSPTSGLDFWVVFIPQAAGCVLAICCRITAALANVVVAGGISLAAAAEASGGASWVDIFAAIWLIALICVFQVIAWAVALGGLRFDEERAATARRAVATLPSGIRDAEQRRLDAMIHDRLIALLVALRPGPLSAGFADTMPLVLDELKNWSATKAASDEQIATPEFIARLRLSVEDIGDGIDVETTADAAPQTEFPADVADAVIEAVGEAVRNIHRHAGAGASGAVLVDVHDDAIAAVVADDGAGFEPQAVSDVRIGLALGIRERMGQIEGGHSRVLSAPGAGTRVELTWSRPDVPE